MAALRNAPGSAQSPNFQQIFCSSPSTQTLVLVVADIGTPSATTWTDSSSDRGSPATWFDAIPRRSKAPGLSVFSYANNVKVKDNLWQSLLEHGAALLQHLLDFIQQSQLESCPVMLISHSLSGVMVKEAVRLAYYQQQGTQRCRAFIRQLAGVMLLGTPHTSLSSDKWMNASILVDRLQGKRPSIMSNEVQQWATEFMLAGIDAPILSAYETQETKIPKGNLKFGRSKKVQIMDESFVKTGLDTEQLLAIESDHPGLCNLNVQSTSFAKICQFIDVSLEDARLKISQGSPIYEGATFSSKDPWSLVSRTRIHDDVSSTTLQVVTLSNPASTPTSTNMNDTPPPSSSDMSLSEMNSDISRVTVENTLATGANLSFPLHLISSMPETPHFFGRLDVLSQIDETFFSTEVQRLGNETRTFAICGPGGMGKSQIAASFAQTRRSHFDAIFWIHAASSLKLRDEFAKIAISLGLVDEDSADARDQAITRELVKNWLYNPPQGSNQPNRTSSSPATWLIVFDNVDDTQVLEGFLPLGSPGCVLFTSRDPTAKHSTFLAKAGIDLQPLNLEDSSRLLESLTQKHGNSSAIHKRLGGLPLAITQMAKVIVRLGMTYEEFAENYDEEIRSRGSVLLQENVSILTHSSDYNETIWSVWAFDSLKHSRPLLDVLAVLDPDGIPESILSPRTGTPKLVAGYPDKMGTYLRARAELFQSSLVSRDRSSRRLVVHRLVQDAARAKMSPERFHAIFSSALCLVSLAWQFEDFGWRHSVHRWKICEELVPHVLQLYRFGDHINVQKDTIGIAYMLAKLLTDAAWYYHETGFSMDSQPLFEFAQTLCESIKVVISRDTTSTDTNEFVSLSQIDSTLAELHHNLGCIGTETNQPSFTLKHFQTFNQMMIESSQSCVQKGDHWLHISWNELGNALMMNKRWQEGEEAFRKSIQCARQRPNFTLLDVSFPYVNLGLALWLQGQHGEATKTLLEGLRAREKAFGKNDEESFITGRFLHALGNVSSSRGDVALSYDYHTRALRQYERTIGRNHHRTGDVHVKVAEHYIASDNWEAAKFHLDEALRIFNERPYYGPEKSRALFKKSLLMERMGNDAEANAVRLESLRLHRIWFRAEPLSHVPLTEKQVDDSIMFWSR